MDSSPNVQVMRTGGYISTQMVFQNKSVQNAANTTYQHVSSFNSTSPTPYVFKTYAEYLLFKTGQLATVPGATGY
jgi:hypothetical protein